MTTTQGASAEPNVLTIPTAIMELPCTRTMSHFATLHEMDAYKEGHRDARHAAADLVLARADELKALAASPQVEVAQPRGEELTPLDYRAQGREEVLAIILAESPECPFDDCLGWSNPVGPDDEGGMYWKETELRAKLHIGDAKHDAYDRAEAAHWDAQGRKDEAEREMLFVKQAPFYQPLHDFLAKHEAWDLMGDLKRAGAAQVEVAPQAEQVAKAEIPDVLFDGPAVYAEITRMLGKSHCISPVAMATTLDAVVSLMRKSAGATQPSSSSSSESTERAAAPADAQEALDAARYRWLRHADLDALSVGNWGTGQVYEGVKFDDAIDRAMAARQATATRTAEGAPRFAMSLSTDIEGNKLGTGGAEGADKRDAERYRWLRDKSDPGLCAFYLSVGSAFKGVKFARETVDEAIDAQIGAAHQASAPTGDSAGRAESGME